MPPHCACLSTTFASSDSLRVGTCTTGASCPFIYSTPLLIIGRLKIFSLTTRSHHLIERTRFSGPTRTSLQSIILVITCNVYYAGTGRWEGGDMLFPERSSLAASAALVYAVHRSDSLPLQHPSFEDIMASLA